MAITRPLYVIKVGSSTLLENTRIYDEIMELSQNSKPRIILVAGGSGGIKRYYEQIQRPMPMLTLPSGDTVRYCSPEEMHQIVASYQQVTLRKVENELRARGLKVYSSLASEHRFVIGTRANPIKILQDGKTILMRDHQIGEFKECDKESIEMFTSHYDVVCFSVPIAEMETGEPLNMDSDVLAAHLSNVLEANHLRFVTSSAGILKNLGDSHSSLDSVFLSPGNGTVTDLSFVQGRMKQKVKAAKLAVENGVADVCITGPHSFLRPQGRTWFWGHSQNYPLASLAKAVTINSFSTDERELAEFLSTDCHAAGITAAIDDAGNLVVTKGEGARRLLLLGHLDTIPCNWKASCSEISLFGRGVVDAKSSLVNFLEVTKKIDVPSHAQIMVVGATEEEVSSSKGGFFVRDHYSAQAVIIGEPSGSTAITLGYFGLCKLEIRAKIPYAHSAAGESASDIFLQIADLIKRQISAINSECFGSIIEITTAHDRENSCCNGILQMRIAPGTDIMSVETVVKSVQRPEVTVQPLRITPGVKSVASNPLCKAFSRAFSKQNIRPQYLVKRGTSDMNTLATTWQDIPMVAYGPGDSSLDHTDKEAITVEEYLLAQTILKTAIEEWL